MKNVKQAQVTHIFCENYIEIALLENGAPGSQRCVAEDFEKAKRGGSGGGKARHPLG